MNNVGIAVLLMVLVACDSDDNVYSSFDSVQNPESAANAAMAELVEEGFRGSVLVACNHNVVLNQEFGIGAHEEPKVRYWVGSVTKGITAAAVMALVEQGKLQLDDPISKFFPDAPSDKQNITIANLLVHGSGLPQNYAAEGHAKRSDAAAAILAQPLNDLPGAQFNYSNDGYSLLAIIIEIASSLPYEEYVSSTIMKPLGLDDIAFLPAAKRADEFIPEMLSPYEPSQLDVDWGFRGGHGARLSVDELYTLTRGLLDRKIISEESLVTMHKSHFTLSSGLGVGMGWFRETDDAGREMRWMRGSDERGGNALVYVVDQADVVVVAASNAGPDRPELRGWSQAVRDVLLKIYAPADNQSVRANCG
ncbi:MAG: beta-lactamase family protein [Gammaproteobacteria bacterium]|nr:beta-lactamase family protein [Gammaproteobacteria bacterium]